MIAQRTAAASAADDKNQDTAAVKGWTAFEDRQRRLTLDRWGHSVRHAEFSACVP